MHDCDKYGIDLSKVTLFFYFIPAAAATEEGTKWQLYI